MSFDSMSMFHALLRFNASTEVIVGHVKRIMLTVEGLYKFELKTSLRYLFQTVQV